MKWYIRLLACLTALAMLFSCALAEEPDDADDFGDPEDAEDFEDFEDFDDSEGFDEIDFLEEEGEDPFNSFYPQSLFAFRGKLYAVGYNGIWLLGGEEPLQLEQIHPDSGITAVAATDEAVLLFCGDTYTGFSFLRCAAEGDALGEPEELCALQLEFTEDDWVSCNGLVVSGDTAWLLLHSDGMNKSWEESTLFEVDLATGAAKKIGTGFWKCLQPYKDGRLCAFWWDQETAYQDYEHITHPVIVSVDPATGENTTLHTLSDIQMNAVGYDPQTDRFYFSGSTKLFSCAAGEEEETLTAYMIPGYRQNIAPVILDGKYWYIENGEKTEVLSVSTDPSALPSQVLRVAGYSSESMIAFSKAHPEIAVDLVEDYLGDSSDITTKMISADDAADVYSLDLSYSGFTALRDKGYCVDLSSSAVLMDTVSRMYPQFTSGVLQDGHLYALPYEIYAYPPFSYRPDVLETVGLTKDDLPKTFSELIDFIAMWKRDYAEEYPDVQLTASFGNLRTMLFFEAVNAQSSLCEAQGIPLNLNTPALRDLLNKIDQNSALLDSFSQDSGESGTTVVYSYGSDDQTLLGNDSDFMPSMYGHWMHTEPLLVSLSADTQPIINATVNVLLINPNGANREAAMTYLEFIAQNLSPAVKVSLMPDYDEPLEQPYYARSLQFAQEWLTSAEEYLASDPEDRDAQDAVENARLSLEQVENERWAISAEEITRYHEVYAPLMVVSRENIFASQGREELVSLIQRYLAGQLSAEQLLQQCDRILQMIQFENQ